jgi:undecaprenyl-diphosphatase
LTWWLALLLGAVQGITEFLPVSSSGHLSILQNFLGLEVSGGYLLFDVLLHLATLAAVFVAFRKDVKEMVLEFGRTVRDLVKGRAKLRPPAARRLILLLVLATLPLALVVVLKDHVEAMLGMPMLVGAALICTALLLFIADRTPKGKKDERTARIFDVILVGLMQALATVPGLSRSGATISAGVYRGFDRRFAVRFSFLLSVPAVLGAAVLEIPAALEEGVAAEVWPMYIAGMLLAAVTGYLSIRLVKRVAEKGRFGSFAGYCLFVGLLTIVLSLILKP